ncbi:ret finger protein-like 4B isoform X1 [Panthera tigris]|uniref:Ret finger protein like 4B n=1 Tax=Panthera tigris altaica TaxID=74533 RepID=A0A8C9J707_PANTA|nr:ret finger protein-like 4B isoform X1 [Panthera tigris]XP_042842962.1 ret finger protein-like 4B isoform X1 [Panthera tigris]XP_042842963.1 ret finger protein-like 4B isoform X1 [Panthera tigris]XP_042842964.1 ret finger protein-like 4B isoform X1 [Panthera tigris]XP_042842965.1 ret finger protein-like 4B isoform X1 [Panthera tigris]XP_042842966.1 ret finger protein-like 4B isoform X1 [Panthera tigris]XP_042842967.1 ret finger protein-like 4B isoform X1 [Panthera tigris]
MAQSLQEEVTCPVCLEIFLSPVLLPCAHIFCFHCVRRWMLEHRDLKLTCPVCRGVSDSPPLEEWQIGALSLLFTQHSALLEKSLHVSNELLRFREDMTLDTSTAHSFLILSDDLKNVRCGKICRNPVEDPQRFTHLACVLGTPCFSSGCHYWEVEVGQAEEWTLGICQESVDRKRKAGFSSEHGFWFISMKAGTIYTSSFPETRIPASPELSHVGIFLDVEMEEIKFFDVRGNALIYTHSHLSCVEPLRPFFCPELPRESDSGASLKLCS